MALLVPELVVEEALWLLLLPVRSGLDEDDDDAPPPREVEPVPEGIARRRGQVKGDLVCLTGNSGAKELLVFQLKVTTSAIVALIPILSGR